MHTEKRDPAAGYPHLDPGPGLTEAFVQLPDGRRLRAVTAGAAGGPLVVFESGLSSPAACWVHSQREVSARARTLSYDRAGYAGSDFDPKDRTLERTVDDLVGLLDGLGETQPVVLVGHSWGGPVVRLFADRYPHRVAGLVFVDATVAEVMSERMARLNARATAVMSLLARLGGRRVAKMVNMPHGISPSVTPADLAVMLRDYASARTIRAGAREAAHFVAALPTLRRVQAAGTPDVPTICLQAGRIERGMSKVRARFNQVAAELMAAVPDGRVEVVEGAGHLIPLQMPAAVTAAVLEVLSAVATGR